MLSLHKKHLAAFMTMCVPNSWYLYIIWLLRTWCAHMD